MDTATSETVVPATPEETWEALTEPERLEEWLAEDADVDLRPGGDLRIGLEEGERAGFVEEVDEPHRLVFWWADGDEESTRVEIELEPDADGTRVRVVESRPLRDLDAGDAAGARTPELLAVA
jgi:uncharacterized protein YndB with AHSA1/START domain